MNESFKETYWFRRMKRSGRGLQYLPITWQGWLSLVIVAAINIANFYRLEPTLDTQPEAFFGRFFPVAFISGLGLVLLVWKKGDHKND